MTDREAPFPLPRFATDEAVKRTASFLDKWHGRLAGRLKAWAMPFSPETCTAELMRASVDGFEQYVRSCAAGDDQRAQEGFERYDTAAQAVYSLIDHLP